MNTTLKTCLLAGTILCISSVTANATDQHTNHNEHQHAHHTTASVPLDIMGEHTHPKGKWMTSYTFKRMSMNDNLQGHHSISPQKIVSTVSNPNAPPPNLRVVPTKMTMDMHMFGAMYGVTDKFTLMGMAMYMKKDMTHTTFQGGTGTNILGHFTTRSKGWGDTSLTGIYNVYTDNTHTVNINLGLSAPTGSIKEEDTILSPMNTTPTLRLPYAMQLGSGTWDALPAITYTGHKNKYSWGAQYKATLRLESENAQNYRLGNVHTLTGWGGYQLSPKFGAHTYVAIQSAGKIKGSDAKITAPVQTANPDNYGGNTMKLGAGFTYTPHISAFNGLEISTDLTLPVYQDLNGVQMKQDWSITTRIAYRF